MHLRRLSNTALTFSAFLPSLALANEGSGPVVVNYYALLLSSLHLDLKYGALLSSLLTLLICILIGLAFRRSLSNPSPENLAPSNKITLRFFVEMICDFVYSLSKEHCGHNYLGFLPLISALFIFILVCNLTGLVPGFPPATENFSVNLAMGLMVFFTYNIAGFRQHGLAYIKQFTGPFLLLAPLFLGIELISHAVRPLSLAFRLLANIFCDHLLLGVFSNLAPLVVPSLFLCFGLLVAVIQSFVFALLTGIYINMAISHDH